MKINRTGKFAILLLTAAVLAASGVFGQTEKESDPFIGSWEVEVVFGPEPLVFTFTDSGRYIVTEPGGDIDRLSYSLEADRHRIRMQMDEDTSMEWRYSFSGEDEFNLYLTGEDNELMEMLLSGFDATGDLNDLTGELLTDIRNSVRKSVLDHPVIRGRRALYDD